MKAYLSGGMEYARSEGAHWRRELQEWMEATLRHAVFNPNDESEKYFAAHHPGIDFRALKKENLNHYREIARGLVEIDCREIATQTDYLVCYWDEGAALGAGTKGELTMASYFKKPVYLVTPFPLEELPGWVLGCTTRTFPDFRELKSFLAAEYRKEAVR
jgi:hypothetical protein